MTLKEFWKWFNENGHSDYFVDLRFRWQDEKEYENINDYTNALNTHYYQLAQVCFIKGNRNFHFTIQASDYLADLSANLTKGCLQLKVLGKVEKK